MRTRSNSSSPKPRLPWISIPVRGRDSVQKTTNSERDDMSDGNTSNKNRIETRGKSHGRGGTGRSPHGRPRGKGSFHSFINEYVCGVWSLPFLLLPHFYFFKYNSSFSRAEVRNETKMSASYTDDLMAEVKLVRALCKEEEASVCSLAWSPRDSRITTFPDPRPGGNQTSSSIGRTHYGNAEVRPSFTISANCMLVLWTTLIKLACLNYGLEFFFFLSRVTT